MLKAVMLHVLVQHFVAPTSVQQALEIVTRNTEQNLASDLLYFSNMKSDRERQH